ncbi:MAG: fructose-bisphosphate aldolase [Thermomicrobiales bacterium]|nr:MAG: fructose-bisphosphate aldolase [Thermomicrobiales bacterium]
MPTGCAVVGPVGTHKQRGLVTSVIGYQVRLGRLFREESGRSFITAIDHGVTLGVPAGAERAVETVERIVAGGPDAVLIGPGLFAKVWAPVCDEGRAGPGDSGGFLCQPSVPGPPWRALPATGLAGGRGIAMGGEAMIMFLMLGAGGEGMFADNVAAVGRAAQEAHRVGLPLIVEAVLWGSQIENKKDPERLAFACRMAVELGADAIKTEYTGDPVTMRQIIETCPAPVLVLGGAKSDSVADVLEATRGAMEAGARGVIYGRNVWQHDDPVAVSRQLRDIIHSHALAVR